MRIFLSAILIGWLFVCSGSPDDTCCDPWWMAVYMTGPDFEIVLPMEMPCNLNCDNHIDLRDVAIWQNEKERCWDE